MDIRKFGLDYLYYNPAEVKVIVLDGPDRHPDWYHSQPIEIMEFIKKATAFEIIEFVVYAYHKKYADHGALKYKLGGEYNDEGDLSIATEYDRSDTKDIRWKIYKEMRYSEWYGQEMEYKYHLQEVTITFDKLVTGAKDNVIRGLDDVQYQLVTTGGNHIFTVTDSPIASIELSGNVFKLTINEDYTYNYLFSRAEYKRTFAK